MKKLNVAISPSLADCFIFDYETVNVHGTDFTNVAAVVATAGEAPAVLVKIHDLRENGLIPEKADLNSILFLLTPSENLAKLQHLISYICRFEKHIDNDSPMRDVLPSIYERHHDYYEGKTIRGLCRQMHDFYKSHDMKRLQKEMFRKAHFPRKPCRPRKQIQSSFATTSS